MKTRLLICVVALLACAPTVEAANSASAALDWSRLAITSLGGAGYSNLTSTSYVSSSIASSWWTSGSGPTDTGETRAHVADATSSANAGFDGTTLNSQAITAGHYAIAYADVDGSLSLAAHSSIRFAIPYSYALDLGTPGTSFPANFAKSYVGLNVTVPGSTFPFPVFSTGVTGNAARPAGSGWLELVIRNDSAAGETLLFTAMASTEVGNSISPVPEPATLSLFALGAGLAGWTARRGRRRRRA